MSHEPLAEGLSPAAVELLEGMFNSGDSQQLAVAECLNMIASNGDGQEEDEFLIGCAEEIESAASYFVEQLREKSGD